VAQQDRTALDVLADGFGDPVGPDLIANLGELRSERVVSAARAYATWAETSENAVPTRPPSELRPFVTFHAMRVAAAKFRLGIDPSFYTWGPGASPDLVEDGIKQLLLYCHGLVLDDPLTYVMDYFVQGETTDPARRARYRQMLASGLILLSYLRPLIERHIISFVPQDRAGREYRFVAGAAQKIVAETADFSHYSHAALPTVMRWDLARQSLGSIRATLALAEEFLGRFDFSVLIPSL
jgi:hypothetical protein